MRESPTTDSKIKVLLKSALVGDINNRELFIKETSYFVVSKFSTVPVFSINKYSSDNVLL